MIYKKYDLLPPLPLQDIVQTIYDLNVYALENSSC